MIMVLTEARRLCLEAEGYDGPFRVQDGGDGEVLDVMKKILHSHYAFMVALAGQCPRQNGVRDVGEPRGW